MLDSLRSPWRALRARLAPLRQLARLPWKLRRYSRALDAWGNGDWVQLATLLEPVVRAGLETDGDRLLLGLAYARQGRLDESIWYFEQMSGEYLLPAERILYCNTYAYALARSGRLEEAKQHVRRFESDRWPKPQREWAERLLAAPEPPLTPPDAGPPLSRRLH